MYMFKSENAFDCRHPEFCTSALAWSTCIKCRIAGCQHWWDDSLHDGSFLCHRNYLPGFCVSTLSHNGKLRNCRNTLHTRSLFSSFASFLFMDYILPSWVTVGMVPAYVVPCSSKQQLTFLDLAINQNCSRELECIFIIMFCSYWSMKLFIWQSDIEKTFWKGDP